MKPRAVYQVIWLLCFAVVAPQMAWAQESINHASVSGRVTDPSGAVVEGAQVTARQIETNLTSSATTDREGRFRFAYLRVVHYEIQVHRLGFAIVMQLSSAFGMPSSSASAAIARSKG